MSQCVSVSVGTGSVTHFVSSVSVGTGSLTHFVSSVSRNLSPATQKVCQGTCPRRHKKCVKEPVPGDTKSVSRNLSPVTHGLYTKEEG